MAVACGSSSDDAAEATVLGPGADRDAASPDGAAGDDASAGAEAGAGRPLPPAVNALVPPGAPPDAAPVPLYRLRTPNGAAIAFRQSGATVEALDQSGRVIWTKDVGAGALFGGFDVDGDGIVDLGLVRAKDTTTPCYGKPLAERTIDLVLGASGAVVPKVVPPLTDICWSFGYATEQWTVLAALFGAGSKDLVLQPQYTSTNENAFNPYSEGKAWVVGVENGAAVTRGTMTMPTVPAYDAFAAAQLNAQTGTTKHYAASHVPNGVVVGAGDAARLLFFTSGRAVQYAMAAPFALTADRPWLTGGRTDLVGRNYGLVMPNPLAPDKVALVAGTGAISLFEDMRTGQMAFDKNGQIERHVAVYDAKTNTVDDRFHSYSHDGNDAFLYEGRTAYPNGVWLASRLVYDVYQGGHWHTIVTTPGATTTALDVRDLFVWDVRDVDGDGELDVIASPSRDLSDADVPGYYFAKWRTVIFRWDEGTKTLVPKKTVEGAIPWLVASFRDATRSTSFGFTYPALTVATDDGGVALVLRKADGTRLLVNL